jgi:hypothetical protein
LVGFEWDEIVRGGWIQILGYLKNIFGTGEIYEFEKRGKRYLKP